MMHFSKNFFFLLCVLVVPACGNSSKSQIRNYNFEELEQLRYEAESENQQSEKQKKYILLTEMYKNIAEKGDASAQFILGDIYARGLNGNTNEKLGFEWSKKAADNNNVDAMIVTAMNYESGTGTNKNITEAKKYYSKAAKFGNAQANYSLGKIYLKEKSIDKGIEKLEQSALQDDPYALFDLGLLYCEGNIVKKNYHKCNEYWEKAAKMGHTDSAFNVGINFQNGYGEKNIEKAIIYYKIASERNEGKASYNLGLIYSDIKYGNYDKKQSQKYFQKALEQGVNEARNKILN